MAEAESYSLHDIRRGRDFPGSPPSARATGYDNTTDGVVHKRLQLLSIQLYTRPCYAALSAGPLPTAFHHGDFSAAYNSRYCGSEVVYNWIPSFSGRRFRCLTWIMLWFVVGLHWLISISHLPPDSVLRSVAPAVLCSGLAALTMQVVFAEIRRESHNFRSKTSSKVSQARRLWHYRWLVVYIVAPLLSVPLWTAQFSSEPQWFIWFRPQANLLTFSSWRDAIKSFPASVPNVQGTLHWLGEVSKTEHAWEDWRILLNKSELATASHRYPGVPDVFKFDRNAGNRGYVYGWEDTIKGEVLAMPVFVPARFDASTISAHIRALIELLAPSFECIQLTKSDPWTINETVSLNFENCNALIQMQKETLSKQARLKLEQDFARRLRERRMQPGHSREEQLP